MRKLNTLFVGKVLLSFPQLSSTNSYAIDYLSKTTPSEGTVISTDDQTAGRGQIGRSWQSEAGQNIHLSIILYPRWLAARDQFLLSQAVGLAVAEVATELSGTTAQVKWPNDVYLNNRKVAGILIQNSLAGSAIQWSVVGIGINVNQNDFPQLIPAPTSLSALAGRSFVLDEVKELLFTRVEQNYLQLKNKPEQVTSRYHQSLYRFGQWADYEQLADSARLHARIVGINQQGKLGLELLNGEVRYFGLQEVKFL